MFAIRFFPFFYPQNLDPYSNQWHFTCKDFFFTADCMYCRTLLFSGDYFNAVGDISRHYISEDNITDAGEYQQPTAIYSRTSVARTPSGP